MICSARLEKIRSNQALLMLVIAPVVFQSEVPSCHLHPEILLFLLPPLGGWDREKKQEDGQRQRE